MIKKENWLIKLLKKIMYFVSGKKERRIPFCFEVHVTDSCNLNCAGCTHFSPLAKKESCYPLDKFEEDLSRISDIFSDDIEEVHILGGEPLIQDNINEYLRVARKCLPNTSLELITNAILIKNMPDGFFNCCKDNNIKICVSKYPINIDYTQLYEFVKNKGVYIRTYGVKTECNSWKNIGLSKKNKMDYIKTFLKCKYSNTCINLRKGKLFYCAPAAYIDIFNSFFNEDYDNSESGISIYDHTQNEILDFLRTPKKFCQYCHTCVPKNKKTAWSLSKKEKSEWVMN